MNRKITVVGLLTFAALTAGANQLPTNNANPTYNPSNIQAQLRLNVREDVDTVHFVRDTNDPKIITKTYLLRHADPYSIRPYLREMVQTLRVDYNNTPAATDTDYYNTYSKDNAAKTKKIFVPTGIECLKFTDGRGVLIVSAEDYRFADSAVGLGIDSLVDKLDIPDIKNSSGQPKFIYFPAHRPAKELQNMIKLVGANVSNDTVELIGGKDKVELDEDLNCLFFNTALYSRKHIEEMLKIYDIAHPEVKISCTVYELSAENDGVLGFDFQSWKNNEGMKLFSTGGNMSRNYNIKDITAPIAPNGTVNTHYFNFQPQWSTKFLDFLVSKGKAKIASRGELTVKNGATGTLSHSSGILYAAATPLAAEKSGNEINLKVANDAFKFQLQLIPSITEKATTLDVKVAALSMLGYTSDGTVRSSSYSSEQKVMLGNGKNRFYLGGIDKNQIVSDVGGIPLLKDIPLLGWLFASERESTKKSQLVVVAECELVGPGSTIDPTDLDKIELIIKGGEEAGMKNSYGYRQYLLDSER